MKLAVLLPGYLDSPDYLHMKIFAEELQSLGYIVVRLDPCSLWGTGNAQNYSITNYLQDIRRTIDEYKSSSLEEVVLIGHSLGGFVAVLAARKFDEVTKIVALCPPATYIGSEEKWKGKEFRASRRFLPEDDTKYQVFHVPNAFTKDSQKYSALEDIKDLDKPLMVFIAMDDTVVLPEVTEKLVSAAKNPHVIRREGIGHDFRNSVEQSRSVMKEIELFLKQ
jgi:pimeloyl-ACP methyl ester carboxylesterase